MNETRWRTFVALGIGGLSLVLMAPRRRRLGRTPDHKRAALRAYLEDHLAGSDAAFRVVARISQSHRGTRIGELCTALHREFAEERKVVRGMLDEVGGSGVSIKRMAGTAAGTVAQAASGGRPGDLALFRTLESLAVGVQGKRLLWRAAQRLTPTVLSAGALPFEELESLALDQWERIESCRLALLPATFAAQRRDE